MARTITRCALIRQFRDTARDTTLRVQNGVGVVRIRINPRSQSEQKIWEILSGKGEGRGFGCNRDIKPSTIWLNPVMPVQPVGQVISSEL